MLNDHPTQHEPLAAVEREIKDKGGQAGIHLADVSLETDVKAMFTETGKLFGSLDAVGDHPYSLLNCLFDDSLLPRWLQMQGLLTSSHSLTVSDA